MAKKYEKYKDSGVEWVGEIPEYWEVRKLKYLAKINSSVLPENFGKNNTINYIDISNVDFNNGILNIQEMLFKNAPSRARRVTKNNDIIVSTVRTYLKAIALIDKDNYIVSTGFSVISSDNEINPRFMFFYTKSESFINYISAHSDGVSYPAINKSNFDNSICSVPPLSEQQKISSYLDKKSEAIDKFIKNKEELLNLLEEEKKATITKVITKGLDKTVKLRKSGEDWLGEIPEHWETYRTKFLFSLIAKPSGRKHNLKLLSIYTDIGVKPRQELEEKGNKASSTDGYWLVKKGDFIVNKLLAWMGAIGLSEYDGVTSPAYDILRKKRSLDEYYYNYLFRCGILFEEIKKYSKGIMEMRLRLYFTEFSKIFLPYPPLEEQQAIVAYLDEETKKIDGLKVKYRQEIDLIKEYKERLIYDVVTGKISVLEH